VLEWYHVTMGVHACAIASKLVAHLMFLREPPTLQLMAASPAPPGLCLLTCALLLDWLQTDHCANCHRSMTCTGSLRDMQVRQSTH
jgi:hypothetical protein